MTVKRVAVWGTGNVGRPALRAVIAHQGLELAAVIVAAPAKEGLDAGELAGLDQETGVLATRDWKAVLDSGIDAVVYAAIVEGRTEEALDEIMTCLAAGANVVAAGFYALQNEHDAPADLLKRVEKATSTSATSLMVSGIDPGWNMDVLPIALSSLSSKITEIRAQEVMNYRDYHQPDIVRYTVGFGQPMDEMPPMLTEESLHAIWGPMVRAMGKALECPVERISSTVERRPLDETVDVPGMGLFEMGTMGAFRFQVIGHHGGGQPFVIEHITRIYDACAPDWPYPAEGAGCHRIIITGNPVVNVTVHSEDPQDPGPASGGNATAACRLVNAIPAVCAAPAGLIEAASIPLNAAVGQLDVG
jgi:2,4-diaminopentanoate dehydrogenase